MCQFSSPNKCIFEEKYLYWNEIFPNSLLKFNQLPTDTFGNCIFHSQEVKWKKENLFFDYFLRYIDLSIKDENINSIDLTQLIITGDKSEMINLSGIDFTKPLNMKLCTFEGTLDMRNSTFNENVDIYKSMFNGPVYFNKSKFHDRTKINNCIFNKPAYFNDSEFTSKNRDSYLSFTESIFKEQANFSDTKYLGANTDVNFQLVNFKHNVYFTASKFERHAIFNGTHFEGNTDFRSVIFENNAVFVERVQNDLSNIVVFNSVDFSLAKFNRSVIFQNTKFNKAASFDETMITQCSFKDIFINSDLSFNNSKLGLADFDNFELNTNGRIIFRGVLNNKVLTSPTNFNIADEKINGFISFENTKMSWINKNQVDFLLTLEKKGKVYFDNDCEFEANVKILAFRIEGHPGNYKLFKTIFQKLEEWIALFTNNIQTFLQIDTSSISSNEMKIKVVWQREEDYKLFQTLSKYYFECLNEKSENQISEILSKISSPDFLNSFSTDNNIYFSNLNNNLKDIIDDVIDTFGKYIKNCDLVMPPELSKNLLNSQTSLNFFPNEQIDIFYFLNLVNNALINFDLKNVTLNINMINKTIISGKGHTIGNITQQNQIPESSNDTKAPDDKPSKIKTILSAIPEWAKILAGLGAIATLVKVIIEYNKH
ncbi:hypothetical protein GCM10011514_41110 [Emticicia aquatilis]|uniref:Pentapeptide repeat-containing protein n=1 Tax=Emticicia aquatilis TaxID=1537369 RepID=A0A916Z2D8_9BACT|nr:pentapeptide repeat-containing protein [Emticicia aquatilis]GGD72801.1 hypothetical protein GCM10011514_41110 [Emticicia aquatilis]